MNENVYVKGHFYINDLIKRNKLGKKNDYLLDEE